MDLSVALNYFNILKDDKLSFIYQGSFNNEITNKIIDLSSNIVVGSQTPNNLVNKVSFLMAECFQNVVRHSSKTNSKKKNPLPSGMFFSRQVDNYFIISSANAISNRQVPPLKKKLDKINKMGEDQLNALYLEVLGNSVISEKGGAGLGLIEMARKSKQKLEYSFARIDRYHSVFYLQIHVNLTNKLARGEQIEIVSIDDTIDLHDLMIKENILIIHKGDFSNESVIPILKMIENNIPDHLKTYAQRKRTYHLVVEILQNVCKHAPTIEGAKEGIFIMAKSKNDFIINTGNFIENTQKENLLKHLDSISAMNTGQLEDYYKDILRDGRFTRNGGAGLGLLDILRDSYGRIEYKFFDIDDKLSFYVLSTRI